MLREYAARYVYCSCDLPGILCHYGTKTHVNATCIRGLAFGIWIWQEIVRGDLQGPSFRVLGLVPGCRGPVFEMIEAGRCQDLTKEAGDFMQNTLPHLSWVFGPGENGGHSFTVTGEGQVAKQLLAEYWHSRSVAIPNWTFYGSRQPTPAEKLNDIAIALGEQEQVDVETLILKTSVDDQSQTIDIVAWHPALERVPQEHHYQILFLLLDEVLGEFGTQTWLGNISIEPIAPHAKNRSLAELPDFIQQVCDYHKWDKLPPLRSYSVYEVSKQTTSHRGDTLVGTTSIPHIICEFLKHDGTLPEDPFEGTGAELAYVAMDSSVLPEGGQSEARGKIEDALSDSLEKEWSGRTLGGTLARGRAISTCCCWMASTASRLSRKRCINFN